MRLYKSKRFAVYGHQNSHMHILRYKRDENLPCEYYAVIGDDDQSMILTMLNTELSEDVDALLAAYITMEAPYQ